MIGAISTIALNLCATYKSGVSIEKYGGNFTLNVMGMSVAVFIAFKYMNLDNCRINTLIVKVSKYSFGAYLVHMMIMEYLSKYLHYIANSISLILAIPIMSIIVCVLATLISAMLNHVPIANKYLV